MDAGRPPSPQTLGRPEMGLGPAWMRPPKQALVTPDGQRLGGRRRRVVAYLIDALLLLIAFLAVRIAFGPPLDQTLDPGVSLAYSAVSVGSMLAYQVGLWTGGRATVGMRLLGLRVVSAEDGGPVGVGSALRRWVVLEGVTQLLSVVSLLAVALASGTADTIISLLIVGWPILLLATTTADERRQGLHDKIGRTYVVRR